MADAKKVPDFKKAAKAVELVSLMKNAGANFKEGLVGKGIDENVM